MFVFIEFPRKSHYYDRLLNALIVVNVYHGMIIFRFKLPFSQRQKQTLSTWNFSFISNNRDNYRYCFPVPVP
jgi:hypothetical protein